MWNLKNCFWVQNSHNWNLKIWIVYLKQLNLMSQNHFSKINLVKKTTKLLNFKVNNCNDDIQYYEYSNKKIVKINHNIKYIYRFCIYNLFSTIISNKQY